MRADPLARIAQLPLWVRSLALLALGAVASLGQAPFGWPLTSLLAFALAIAFFRFVTTPKRGFQFGWLFGTGYFLLAMQWIVSPFLVEPDLHGWMAPFALVMMAFGLSLFWGAAGWLTAKIGPSISFAVTLPIAELARAYVFGGFPWGMPAYGLVDSMLGQSAAWLGSHGVNLIFLLIAAAIALAFLASRKGAIFSIFIALCGAFFILMPAPDAIKAPMDAPVMRLVQPNAPQDQKWDRAFMPVFFDRALTATAATSDAQPALVIWPETSLPELLNYSEDVLSQISDAAGGGDLLIGANRLYGPLLLNAAAHIGPTGTIRDIYDKHHLVPFGEYMPLGEWLTRWGIQGLAPSTGNGFYPGEGAKLFDIAGFGQVLPLICYEMVFPQDLREAPARPDMIIHLTNDAWFGTFAGPYQHLVQAQMRAIEQGLPIARAANTGVSAMIDAHGRIVASLPLNTDGYLDVRKQPALPQTLYAWMGDGPILAVFLLLLLGIALSRPSKTD